MYAYISDTCRQEARNHNIEERLEELRQWVEELNQPSQDKNRELFASYFEVFESPFYVKKKVQYTFRILTKLVSVQIDEVKHDVVVFFKVFHRSDREYEQLFTKSKERAEVIYAGQHLDEAVKDHVVACLEDQNTSPSPTFECDEATTLLYQAKDNALSLVHHQGQAVYHESMKWRYDICPYLGEQKRLDMFTYLSQKPTTPYTIQNIQFGYQDSPTPALVCREDGIFGRYLSIDVLRRADLWQKANAYKAPLYLNELQDQIAQRVFYQPDGFPLIVDGTHNTGKTALLALLYVHFVLQKSWQGGDFLPCLLLCQPHETAMLRLQIRHHLEFFHTHKPEATKHLDKKFWDDLPRLLARSCTDLVSFLLSHIDNETKERQFNLENFVDRTHFERLWQKSDKKDIQNHTNLSADLCWSVITYFIKGDKLLTGNHKPLSDSLDEYSRVNIDTFTTIKKHVWQKWYLPLTTDTAKPLWDLQDLLVYIKNKNIPLKQYASLLVDDAHAWSNLSFDVILQANLWHDHADTLSAQIPLVFMGNQLKALPAPLYVWHDNLQNLLRGFYGQSLDISPIINTEHLLATYEQLHTIRAYSKVIKHQQPTIKHEHHNLQVFLVDKNDPQQLQALISNTHINLILNTRKNNCINYLGQAQHLPIWLKELHHQYLDSRCYGRDFLPTKSYAVALIGFFEFALTHIFNTQELPFWSFAKRLELDSQLNTLNQAIMQGLQKVFILSCDGEVEFWQNYLGEDNVRFATLSDINEHFELWQHRIQERYQHAIYTQDYDAINHLAEECYQNFDYVKYCQALAHLYHHSPQHQNLDDFIKTPEQLHLFIEHLWYTGNLHLLHKIGELPNRWQGNQYALQLCDHQPIENTAHALRVALDALVSQHDHPKRWRTWQDLSADFLSCLCQASDLNENFYRYSEQQLQKLPEGWVGAEVFAFLAYQQGDFNRCLSLYQNAQSTHDITLPATYYQALLRTKQSWQEDLLCHIMLNNKEQLMNILNEHNLNDLQLTYWDKLLPYLEDDQDFEIIIKQILHHIDSQAILDRLYQFCENQASDNFLYRLDRFKTVLACLAGDLDMITTKIKENTPVATLEEISQALSQRADFRIKMMQGRLKPNKRKTNTQSKGTQRKLSDELSDILHMLNFCPKLKVCQTQQELTEYQSDTQIVELFDALRANFAIKKDNEIIWGSDFAMVRYLLLLLEKSPEPIDSILAYGHILGLQNGKSTMADFALSRLMLMFGRLEKFDNVIPEEQQQQFALVKEIFDNLSKHANIAPSDNPYDLHGLGIKPKEERISSILALTNEENNERQRKLQAQINAQKEQEAKEALKAQQEKQRQDRLAKVREAYEKAEQERLEREARAEQERQAQLEKEQLEQERLEKERLEQERQAQLAQQQAERQAQERLAQQQAEQARQATQQQEKEQSQQANPAQDEPLRLEPTPPLPVAPPAPSPLPASEPAVPNHLGALHARPATSTLHFFEWRVFLSRPYQRLNLESLHTGERWSLQLNTGQIQSDWACQILPSGDDAKLYHISALSVLIYVYSHQIKLYHTGQGVWLTLDL